METKIKKNISVRLVIFLAAVILVTNIPAVSETVTASSAAGFTLGSHGGNLNKVPVQSASLVPLGMTAGIKIFADGVLVAGMSAFQSGDR